MEVPGLRYVGSSPESQADFEKSIPVHEIYIVCRIFYFSTISCIPVNFLTEWLKVKGTGMTFHFYQSLHKVIGYIL